MPWTKEEKSEYMKRYYQENKEKLAENINKYQQENKEKKAEYNKQYNKQYMKQYQHTPKGRKSHRIGQWKHKGLIDSDNDNYESLYTHYINTQKCEHCNVELTKDKYNTSTTKVLDHSHITGLFRNILCHACNIQRGEDKF